MKKNRILTLMLLLHSISALYLLPTIHMIFVVIFDLRRIVFDSYPHCEIYIFFTVFFYIVLIYFFKVIEDKMNVELDFNVYSSLLYLCSSFISVLFYVFDYDVLYYLIAMTVFSMTIVLDKFIFQNKLKEEPNPIKKVLFVRNFFVLCVICVPVSVMIINIL